MSVEDNKATLRRIFGEVFDKKDYSIIPELIDDTWTYKNPIGLEFRGPKGFKQFAENLINGFPDTQMTIDQIIGENDTVAAYVTWRGTFSGKFGNLEPTGKKIDLPMTFFIQFKDGKEIKTNSITDMQSFYQQLGIAD